MIGRFYHVALVPNPNSSFRDVQQALNEATDWFRYMDNAWIIYTTESAEVWTDRLREFVDPDGIVLVFRLNMSDRQGWMAQEFWDWLNKNRA